MKQLYSYHFYLNKENGNLLRRPIYLRITANRKFIRKSTNIFISEKEWDSKRQKPVDNTERISKQIRNIEEKIFTACNQLEEKNLPVSASRIFEIIEGKDSVSHSLLNYFDDYIQMALDTKQFGSDRAIHFYTCRRRLSDFIIAKYKIPDITIDSVDLNFIEGFNRFLFSLEELESNTINGNYHKKLKQVLRHALIHSYIKQNPYLGFKIKRTPGHRDFLDENEIN